MYDKISEKAVKNWNENCTCIYNERKKQDSKGENIMKQPYLIQTGTFQSADTINGLDSIVSLTHVGAAEFEMVNVKENGKYVSKNLKKNGLVKEKH